MGIHSARRANQSELNADVGNVARVIVGCGSRGILNKLKTLVRQEALVDVVAACSSGEDIFQACEQLTPDLAIIDSRIPDLDVVSLITKLASQSQLRILLVSESDECHPGTTGLIAVEVKPKIFDETCLHRSALSILERKLCGESRSDGAAKRLFSGLNGREPIRSTTGSQGPGTKTDRRDGAEQRMLRKLVVRDSGVVKVVPFDDIEWVDAAGDYMCVHARGETLVMRSTLRELMEKLDARVFARIHRSTIVNIEKIVSLTPLAKGAGLLELSMGKTLKVSRNYRDSVKGLFQ
ncbi:MAG: LytR/AlgR family response regulator transcription factor [Pseudomonadales bacterium]|mgnify:CR=1 FL=1